MTKRSALILAVVLFIGFSLRFHNYAVWPRNGATFDEYAWTWLGLSTLESGVPTSWSPHLQYKLRVPFQNQKGAAFTLVTPYLEHPPLFGLVAGTFAKLNGITFMGDFPLAKMRVLSLFLGVLSILAVYLLGKSVAGERIGLTAAAVYALIPTVAIGSRLVENENFFIPFFLLGLYCLNEYVEKQRKSLFLPGVLIVSLLPLAKVPWMAAPAAAMAFLLSKKKWKDAGFVMFATLGFFSIFLLWGIRWDAQVFANLWKLQLARYDISFDGIYALLTQPLVSDRGLSDGWIYAGWASMMLLSLKEFKKLSSVLLGFLAYLGVFLIAIPNEPGHGWYRYPFYPFLAIGLAFFLREYFNKNFLLTFFFLIATGLSMFALSWQRVFGFSYGSYRGYIIAACIGLIPLILPQRFWVRFGRYTNIVLLLFVSALTIWSITLYTEQ